jgi:hypothetical protein
MTRTAKDFEEQAKRKELLLRRAGITSSERSLLMVGWWRGDQRAIDRIDEKIRQHNEKLFKAKYGEPCY